MMLSNSIRLYSNLIYYSVKNRNARDYQRQWNNYWSSIHSTGTGGEVLWDNISEEGSEADLARFRQYINPSLPILDLGSGNGRQTRFLAKHFDRVIGVDASVHAIELARKESAEFDNIQFRVADLTDVEQAKDLHAEFGDMNVYMRGVFHVIQEPDRPDFVRSLAVLLGGNGALYQIELSADALDYFRTLPGDSPSTLPRLLHKVVENGIRPIGFKLEDARNHFPEQQWQIFGQGNNVTINTIPLSHGAEGHVPANYLIVRPKAGRVYGLKTMT